MARDLGPCIRIATPVHAVRRQPWGVELTDASGTTYRFDHVVMACHGDQARALIDNATQRERELLDPFRYQPNRAVVHGDERLMPRRRAVWSSWNYLAGREASPQARISVTYWMNSLQSLDCPENVFVSLNPLREPDPKLVHCEIDYAHPVFTQAAVRAQSQMQEIQGNGGLWYAGAWLGNGFHEDGLRAAVSVAQALGADPPWEKPSTIASFARIGRRESQPAEIM
jgi:predicted NAD/FAD-binding protein